MIRAVEAGSVSEAWFTHNLYKLVRFFSGSTGPESELPYSSSETMPVSALNDCGMVPVSELSERSLRASEHRSAKIGRARIANATAHIMKMLVQSPIWLGRVPVYPLPDNSCDDPLVSSVENGHVR